MGRETEARPVRHAGRAWAEVSFEFRVSSQSVRKALVALGSNLGDSAMILLQAMERLEHFSVTPLLRSSLWLSTPVDCPPGSPRFVNAVVAFSPRPEETPESLLVKLQQIEIEFGRRPRKIQNEPRSLDLDLVAFGAEVRATAELTLPHPRAHLRRFVLQPLSEIAPDLVLAGQTKTVQQLLAGLRTDEILSRVQS